MAFRSALQECRFSPAYQAKQKGFPRLSFQPYFYPYNRSYLNYNDCNNEIVSQVRTARIELAPPGWKPGVLPLNHVRLLINLIIRHINHFKVRINYSNMSS